MNTIKPATNFYPPVDARSVASQGLGEQLDRLQRNVTEVARPETGGDLRPGSRERALVEQKEIENAARANARSLKAADEILGTIIDIKA